MTMQLRLIAAAVCLSMVGCRDTLSSNPDLLPISTYGLCIARPDADTNVRVYAPVDVEFAQIIEKGRVVAQFEITTFGSYPMLSPGMREIWAQGGFVFVGTWEQPVMLLTRNAGDLHFPDLHINLTTQPGLEGNLSTPMLMASLRHCSLRPSVELRELMPRFEHIPLRANAAPRQSCPTAGVLCERRREFRATGANSFGGPTSPD